MHNLVYNKNRNPWVVINELLILVQYNYTEHLATLVFFKDSGI